MDHHFVTGRPDQADGFFGFLGAVTALVQLENAVIHALDAQLHLGHALPAHLDQVFNGD